MAKTKLNSVSREDEADAVDRRILAIDYHLFILRFWEVIEPETTLVENWHIEYLAGILQAEVERIAAKQPKTGDIVINIPPRAMKSYIVTIMLNAWAWARFPHMKFISTSYNASLAADHAMKTRRIIQSPLYQKLWGHVFKLRMDQDTKTWFENDKGGARRTAGTGGGITGAGCDCVPYWVKIETKEGPKSIGEIFEEGGNPMVWSFNHSTGERELSKVIAMRRVVKNGLIKIRTRSGGELDCTSDHRIFTEGRYRKASICERGQTSIFFKTRSVRGMWGEVREAREGMPNVFREYTPRHRDTAMREMREGNQAAKIRGGQGEAERAPSGLLQLAMLERLPGGSTRAPMQAMREDDHEEQGKMVLLGGMQAKQAEQGDKANMRRVRENLYRIIEQEDLLREELREQGARKKDDGSREFSHEEINEPNLIFQGCEEIHKGTGWNEVPGVRVNEKNHCPSCRWGLQEQLHREHDHALRNVSSLASSFENDTISSVERISDEEHEVYDIEVEGNHNFFAGGILVHNCLIADDPINPVDMGEASLDAAIRWWDTVAYSRLNDQAVGLRVVIMQRLHERDLSGHLAERAKKSKTKRPIRRFVIPADDSFAVEPSDLKKYYRDGLFWPERFTAETLDDYKLTLGSTGYANQMGQSPMPADGIIFKKEWFRRYDPDALNFTGANWRTIQSWDLTFKESDDGALNAGQTWTYSGAKYYLRPGEVARKMEYTKQREAIKAMRADYPMTNAVLVEDAANAQAILSDLKGIITGLIVLQKRTGKVEAAQAVAPIFEAGQVFIPIGPEGDDFIASLISFPRGRYKDRVDACTLFLNWARKNVSRATIAEIGRNEMSHDPGHGAPGMEF